MSVSLSDVLSFSLCHPNNTAIPKKTDKGTFQPALLHVREFEYTASITAHRSYTDQKKVEICCTQAVDSQRSRQTNSHVYESFKQIVSILSNRSYDDDKQSWNLLYLSWWRLEDEWDR